MLRIRLQERTRNCKEWKEIVENKKFLKEHAESGRAEEETTRIAKKKTRK